jgi:mRNA interferase RelE/StbE
MGEKREIRAKVIFPEPVIDDLSAIPARFGQQILDRLPILEEHPRAGSRIPLKGLEQFRWLIVGDYRVIYDLDEKKHEVILLRIEPVRRKPPTVRELKKVKQTWQKKPK